MKRELFVVAGEASGDRAAAAVLARLPNVSAFGMGGAALEAEGVDLVADLRDVTALGIGEPLGRIRAIASARNALLRAVKVRAPAAALLVNYTEFNTHLARRLHAAGVRVLWYGAPQIWAWRKGRASSFRRTVDRMAVMLPFEEQLWRDIGVDAEYVGHPAFEGRRLNRIEARKLLGLTPDCATVAILPGSRRHEVERLLSPMLAGYERVRHDRASLDARVLIASSLDSKTRERAMSLAKEMRVGIYEVDARGGALSVLRAFDVAVCASGTAALEATLARAVPVVAYQVGFLTELVARSALATRWVSLPNILLRRTAFPELLQREARAPQLAKAIEDALDTRDDLLHACDEVEAIFGTERVPSHAVARCLAAWLEQTLDQAS